MLKYIIITIILMLCISNLYSQSPIEDLEFYTVRYSDQKLCKIDLKGNIEEIAPISVPVGKYFGFDYNKISGKAYAVLGYNFYEVDLINGDFNLISKLYKTDNVSFEGSSKLSFDSKGDLYIYNEKIASGQGKLYRLDNLEKGELIHLGMNTSGMASILGIEFDDEDNLWNVDECCSNAINRFNLNNGTIDKQVKLSKNVGFPTDLDYVNGEMYFFDIKSEFNSKTTELYKVNLETGQLTLISTYNDILSGLTSVSGQISPPKTCDFELFDYSDLESKYNLEANGDQLIYKDFIRMTDDFQYQKSFLNYKDYINITNDFQTSFTFRVDDNARFEDTTSKEDGFAFIIYNDSTFNYNAIKSNHFYEGFTNAFVVEVDLFQNYDYFRDPNDNHIAVFASKNEISPNHDKNDVIIENLNLDKILRDNREYTLYINYNKDRSTLKIDLEDINSKKNVITLNNFSFSEYINLKNDRFAKIGILSSTGKTFQVQEIADWKYCSTEFIEILKDEDGIVYPNPSSDYIYLTDFSNIVKVKIIDIYGKQQDNLKYDKNLKRVDITSLKKGIYFVIIESENNTYIRKFIKN